MGGEVLTINGVSLPAFTAADPIATVIANINGITNSTGVTAANVAGVIVLTDAKGRDISLSSTVASSGLANGTYKAPSLLAALGFQETRNDATVFGQHITAPESITSLNYGDLKINGETVSGENTSTLQGKIDNINKLSDTTGVIASLKAENISNFSATKLSTEVTGGTFGPAVAGNIVINGVSVAIAGAAPLATVISNIEWCTVCINGCHCFSR